MLTRDVIIACDFASAEATFAFLDKFEQEPRKPFLKIGMELYYAEGPSIVREIKRRGHRIFLDLKLHDIPNTVRKAMAVLSKLDVDMCNVHAAGTIDMMRAAVEGLTRPDGTRPLLIAVTQLTSTSEERMRGELLIDAPIDEVIVRYARNAREAGLDGVVCSPLEAGMVKQACGAEFLTVTPGVRFADGDMGVSLRRRVPARSAPTSSSWGVPSRRRPIPWRPIAAAWPNSSVRNEICGMRDDDGVSHPKNRRVMKPVKLFYLKNCPFCRKALRYIDEVKAAHPELAAVDIELIEESEQPAVADGYDYYYVPTFYVDGVKVHEGGIYPDEVEAILRKAMK